jgi:hypothetical protein
MGPWIGLDSVEKDLLVEVGIEHKFLGCVVNRMVVEPTELSWLLAPAEKIFLTNFVDLRFNEIKVSILAM